jgi:two-component system, NtrC family, nitrogen regulation sensor histidine kinase NtrY
VKNFKFTLFIVSIAFFIIFIFGVELHYMRLEEVPFSTKMILFILLNLNLIALFTLIFFVGKNLFKIYLEKKEKIAGYKFKTRLVAILVVMTLIPSAFLFVVSSGVVTNYFDRWFDPQIKHQLNISIDLAKSAYDMQRQQALDYAKAITSGNAPPDRFRVYALSRVPDNASETVRAGFEGKSDAEVISGEKGDIVRAVVPRDSRRPQDGVIVVESMIDAGISRNAEEIQEAYRNYLTLESWKLPIKANYLLILGFFTLLIVFTALWIALRVSRGITDPIQELALATDQVAKGNLEMEVLTTRNDEIGLLVNSFNKMVRELKESKDSLNSAWLKSERSRLIIENIIKNINSGVIYLNKEGNILMFNNAACKILCIEQKDIINRNYSVLLSILKSEELKGIVKNIRVWDFQGLERELRVTVGERLRLLRIFITTLGEADNFLGTLVVFDDLTEISRAEKALAWQEVARRMAHEIKNPLTPIQLSTEHMIKKWQNRDKDFDKIFDRSTKAIIKEVQSLKNLVNDFSRFGKMPEIRKTPVMIRVIIDEIINLFKDYRDIVITTSFHGEEAAVYLDEEQFKRVLINLVGNAIQAMQNRGEVEICTEYDSRSNRVLIDIADNGPGIRDEDKEKLFLPYFSTKKDGTGLGLAIASKVVTDHRGYIRIKDNDPTGTVFSIELPIKEG